MVMGYRKCQETGNLACNQLISGHFNSFLTSKRMLLPFPSRFRFPFPSETISPEIELEKLFELVCEYFSCGN